MASLNDIVTAMAATLSENIVGLAAYEYVLPDVATFPAVLLTPMPGDYTQAMAAGNDKWVIMVYVLCSSNDQGAAQSELNTLITGWGASSIRQVIHDNKNLGLNRTSAMALGASNFSGKLEVGSVECVGAIIKVLVHTDPREFLAP